MTVESSDRSQNFAGGQGTLTFTFTASPDRPEDIKLDETVISTGVANTLEYDVEYTVAVNADGEGGVVTVSPTHAATSFYTVYRETAQTQTTDYDDYNNFPANTVESSLDQVTMIGQENSETLTRTLKYPISSTGGSLTLPTPVADNFIVWNSTATGLDNAEIPDPSTLIKASTVEAEAGTEDTHYMTPSKTADAIAALAPGATIASQAQAEAASSNVVVMTPLRVKQEVEATGQITIPNANVNLSAIPTVGVTNGTVTNLTTSTLNVTTIRSASPTTGALYYCDGTKFAQLPQGGDGEVLVSGGAGVAPSFGSGNTGTVFLTSGTSWTSPAGVSIIRVTCIGGGGGGGGSQTASSAGGGGGGVTVYDQPYAITGSTSYTYAVGSAGVGGTAGASGSSGGTTTFDTAGVGITATGGLAGQGNTGSGSGSGSGGNSGLSGIDATDDTAGEKTNWTDGGNGASGDASASGGGGGSHYGKGGDGRTSGQGAGHGADGTGYGSGGSGGANFGSGGSTWSGGSGTIGLIIIQY